MLQSVICGFGGLDIADEGIKQLSTKLPKEWKKLRITGAGKDETTYNVD